MRIGLVSTVYPPAPTGYGVSVTLWGILTGLLDRGHTVDPIVVFRDAPSQQLTPAVRTLTDVGCDVITLGPSNQVTPEYFAKALSDKPPYDLLLCYTTGALSYATAVDTPKTCVMVDLDHLVLWYRRQYDFRSYPITYPELAQYHYTAMRSKDQMLELLSGCVGVIEHAYHHAEWLNEMGIPATYVPMPVADPAFLGWRRDWWPHNPKPRILLAGHVGGIATMSGLYFLAEDVLPHLDIDCDIRIAGADRLTPDLAARFSHYPNVQFLGYVPDIHYEMLNADVFLCPTPIDLGFRTRLAETMAMGCCVVAHEANGKGMPEAVHWENLLLSNNGPDMAHQILQAVAEGGLRMMLSEGARTTYEQNFRPDVSIPKLATVIEGVA